MRFVPALDARTSRLRQRSFVAVVLVVPLLSVTLPSASPNLSRSAAADELPEPSKDRVEYQRDVAPILEANCMECHGEDTQESGLRVDVQANLLKGGDSGEPAIVPGESARSQLIRFVAGLDEDYMMPPDGPRLTDRQVSILRAWIDQGARRPGENGGVEERPTTDHWSFQPVVRPEVPRVALGPRHGAIDAFIQRELQDAGLKPSAPADRVMLIRRLYLDVHGLPPTPARIRRFVEDDSPTAYERLVDQVLDSPRYGERWARHWLDIARFAETDGFETNRERPHAFRYRDYVIEALNSDLPYDRFVREQLAGDAMGRDVATGFLVGGAYDIVKSPDVGLTLMQRQNELDDMINTTGTAFLGLTLGCARCHNHKFDPVSQREYYAFQAVFAGVKHGDREVRPTTSPADQQEAIEVEKSIASIENRLGELLPASSPAINPKFNVETFPPVLAKYVRFTVEESSGAEPCIDELEIFTAATDDQPPCNVGLESRGAVASASGVYLDGNYPIHQLKHVNDGLFGNSHSWIAKRTDDAWVQLEFPEPQRIDRVQWGRDREQRFEDRLAVRYRIEVAVEPDRWTRVADWRDHAPSGVDVASHRRSQCDRLPERDRREALALLENLDRLVDRLRRLRPEPVTAYAGVFESPGTTHRLYRGDPMAPREEVAPDALAVIGSLDLAKDSPEQRRRLALGRWITDPRNPLTARVIVNRVWQHHFGAGIVPTPSDMGLNGQPPSHPELLDWLAAELIDNEWSLKHVHRLILLSATYRQSSLPDRDALAKDADTRLLWRFPPRRLDAEAIRDSILSVSGVLDPRMGGPGFSVFDVRMENVRHYFPKRDFGPDQWRRMIYMTKVRMEQDAVFGVFDCPDGGQVIPSRGRSTTPLQALNLLNSSFMIQQSGLFAQRLQREAESTPDQIRLAFRLCFGRDPVADELDASTTFARQDGLEAFCRALLNCNEFLFLP